MKQEPEITARRRIGIVAGAGAFPFMVASGAKKQGCSVSIVGLRGLADPGLSELADQFCWSGIARPGRWIRVFRRFGASGVILAGSVRKTDMYGRWRFFRAVPDLTAIRLWFFSIADKRNDSILSALADTFQRRGIPMEECIRYCPEDMAAEGVMTGKQPSASQIKDAHFGWKLAKEMGRLDIGQSVAVKETEVIAVEAIEGTDRMIERAGELCRRGGWVLVKAAKPNQDMRFDVPTVGPYTIDLLQKHGAAMLVVEAHKTVIVDRKSLLEKANRVGIVVMGLADVV